MIRRLFRTGNSVVLSLPNEGLDALGLSEGQSLSLDLDREKRRLVLTPLEEPHKIRGVDETFARQVDEFIQKYRTALEELAKRSFI